MTANGRTTAVQKLRLDFRGGRRLFGLMETRANQIELIQRLLLEAGRIMEDGSPDMALQLPESSLEVSKRIDQLATGASALSAIAAAARVLIEPIPARF